MRRLLQISLCIFPIANPAPVNCKQDVFMGPHIWYNMKKQTVVSSSYHDKTGTTVIIEPQIKPQSVISHANPKR